ncbi:MAG: T9SS type A sorting domain-containing protein [Chitinivibrionales bacterium]|nr:T9SS type A sorting domain-containing protein [Chitinivibrionales bacterium]
MHVTWGGRDKSGTFKHVMLHADKLLGLQPVDAAREPVQKSATGDALRIAYVPEMRSLIVRNSKSAVSALHAYVFTASGRYTRLRSYPIETGSVVPLNLLSRGIYFVEIHNGMQSSVLRKIVVD